MRGCRRTRTRARGEEIDGDSVREFFEADRHFYAGLGLDLRRDDNVETLAAKLRAAADKLDGIDPADVDHGHDLEAHVHPEYAEVEHSHPAHAHSHDEYALDEHTHTTGPADEG